MKQRLRWINIMLCIFILCIPYTTYGDQVHRVIQGESLYVVAQKYGITMEEIIKKNYLKNSDTIFPRQVLIIPTVDIPNAYRVKQGDSLYKISLELGISIAALAEKNHIGDWNQLNVGQILFIPNKETSSQSTQSKPPQTYEIKPGDTLYKISKELGISMDRLAQENDLKNWDHLYVGQKLKLPPASTQNSKPVPEYTIPQLLREFPEIFFLKGPTTSNKIALTFDDGPDAAYTSQVLDVLKKFNIPATFFLIGNRADRYPEIVTRIVKENHVIGNHSWAHLDFSKISQESLIMEIMKTEEVLQAITGLKTALIRPPYGAVSRSVLQQTKELNYKVINWSVDSRDWRDKNVDQILINTLPDVREGAILLFHSASGEGSDMKATVEVLPELIETLLMQGYQFVTVDELLNIQAYK